MRDMSKCGPGRYDLVRTLGPLELPRCEAPQVKVGFVTLGIVVVTGELYSYSSSSWLMGFSQTPQNPRRFRPRSEQLSPRQPSSADGKACELAERRFIGHGAYLDASAPDGGATCDEP